MSFILWFGAWMAFWALVFWVVIPWWIRRGVRKGLAAWEAGRNHLCPDSKRPKSLEWDPSDPGTNRGYVPSDGPEET